MIDTDYYDCLINIFQIVFSQNLKAPEDKAKGTIKHEQ